MLGEVHYLLYADGGLIPSKMAIDLDSEDPFVARIRADYIAPPHGLASFKGCLSRVERNPLLARADIFEDISSATPLEEGQMSNFRTDGPGMSPNEPMAIVLSPLMMMPHEACNRKIRILFQ